MITNFLINIFAFVVLTVLWLGFIAALLFDREKLNQIWQWFRRLPLLVQLVFALFTLPVVIGLWVWQRPWPVWLRLTLVLGLAWVTVTTFFPTMPQAG